MGQAQSFNLIYFWAMAFIALHIFLLHWVPIVRFMSTGPSYQDLVNGSQLSGSSGSQLKEHVPPCVVLVINDNPYGLMFELGYICRTCP
jgi:hypothetical protein